MHKRLHSLVVKSAPCYSELRGGGFVQERVRSLTPPPQSLSQEDQKLQALQPPSTVTETV